MTMKNKIASVIPAKAEIYPNIFYRSRIELASRRSGSGMTIRKGFTLIEILIVVSLLGIVMISVTQLLAGVLTGSSKANASQMLKENGQFAISTIERSLKNSRSVTSCSGSYPNLRYSVADNSTGTEVVTYYSYVVESGSTNRLYHSKRIDAGSWVNSYLTNINLNVDAFSCVESPGSPGQPAVYKISLTISKPSSVIEQSIVSQTFETTVSLRTY